MEAKFLMSYVDLTFGRIFCTKHISYPKEICLGHKGHYNTVQRDTTDIRCLFKTGVGTLTGWATMGS